MGAVRDWRNRRRARRHEKKRRRVENKAVWGENDRAKPVTTRPTNHGPVRGDLDPLDPGGDTILDLAGEALTLQAAANAAVDLAKGVERVRLKYLDRSEQEANAALRRRYGLES